MLEICGSALDGGFLPGWTEERFQARPARQRWSGRYDPMLTVVSDSADRDGSGAARSAASSVIDEIVREGARRMLAEALRAEVEAYIAQFDTTIPARRSEVFT